MLEMSDVAQAPITDHTLIGEAEEMGERTISSIYNNYSVIAQNINLPSYNANNLVSREIVLGDLGAYSWTDTMTTGATVASWPIPGVLASNPQIMALKSSYSYFKCTMKFIFRLSCSLFDSGTIYAVYTPYVCSPSYMNTSLTGHHHMLLRTGPTTSGELHIPFIYDERMIETSNIVSGSQIGGFVQVRVLGPLKNNMSASTSTATLTVSLVVTDFEMFLPQSSEANVKASTGSISSILDIGTDVVAAISSAYARDVPAVMGGIRKIAKKFSSPFDKPISVQRGSIVSAQQFDLNNSHGVYTGEYAHINYDSRVSTDPNIINSSTNEMNLLTIASVPMLLNTSTLTAQSLTKISVLGSKENSTNWTYVDWISENFYHYRGSYKFKAYFSSNINIKMRGVFFIGPSTTPSSRGTWNRYPHRIVDVLGSTDVDFTIPYIDSHVALEQNGSDRALYFEVISFDCGSGTTGTTYMHLYKAAGPDFQFSGYKSVGFIPQSSPRMDFAKPFDMLCPGMQYYKDVGIIDGDSITDIKEILMKDQPYEIILSTPQPVDGSAPLSTTIDLFKTTTITSKTQTNNVSGYVGIEKWGLLFYYVRGSMGVRVINPPAHPNYLTCAWPVYIQDSGVGRMMPFFSMTSNSQQQNQLMVPFISKTPFKKMWTGSGLGLPYIELTPAIGEEPAYDRFYFKTVGDDFMFGYLRPPPTGTFNLDMGQDQLRQFLRRNN